MKKAASGATRADVARHANVSETIVSYVLNGNRYVDKGKKERVLKSIQALHYRPNAFARALKGKKSNSLLFIADKLDNEHFSRLVTVMDETAYAQGCLISLCANRNNEAFLAQVISRQYDGIIISSISFPMEYIRRLAEAGIPIVLLMSRDYDELPAGVARIYTGLYKGAKDSILHLQENNRRNILYIDRISKRQHFSDMNDWRFKGFWEQMQECGLPVGQRNIITGCETEEAVIKKIHERIQGGFAADAIFARNDRLACLGIRAAESLGLSVPEDISVIGFDNSSLSQYITPRLTTVEMPRNEIGAAAIEMLYQLINGEIPTDRFFDAKLIRRESVVNKL